MKVTVFTKKGETFEFERPDLYVHRGDCDGFVHIQERISIGDKSYTDGMWWWKETRTYPDFEYKEIMDIKHSLVERIEYE